MCLIGHPDNVAPAIYGGIQLGIHTGERWMTERVNTPPGIQVRADWLQGSRNDGGGMMWKAKAEDEAS
jgi:hypothetical protein